MQYVNWFLQKIRQRPLYPYQEFIADHIVESVLDRKGLTFTVMLSRQMGKNELSAVVEAYLLTCMDTGSIIKAAPTYKPQVITSRQRLLSMIEHHYTINRVWKSFGYIIGVASPGQVATTQTGPRIMFFSADPDANIVGATASLLLEVDEAQDVSVEKFNRDLRPMASTTNATTVLYGTAWTPDTLLAQVTAINQELEAQDGIQRHFQYDWHTLAAINPHYKAFVESEIRRLGEDHPTIRTQYQLQTITGAGFLLNENQHHLLKGYHKWQDEPDEDESGNYVAAMDVGGESRPKQGEETTNNKPDSTVITIARVIMNELDLPCLQIVHQVQWTGLPYMEQYAQTIAICEHWGIRRLVIDKTGLGEGMASMLTARLGNDCVIPFHFTRPAKSTLTYQFLSMINSKRLTMYAEDSAPSAITQECWQQLKKARYRVPGEELLDMYVPPEQGHDDFLISLALCCEATKDWSSPYFETIIIRPRRVYEDESWF